jgi:hypothetical protein
MPKVKTDLKIFKIKRRFINMPLKVTCSGWYKMGSSTWINQTKTYTVNSSYANGARNVPFAKTGDTSSDGLPSKPHKYGHTFDGWGTAYPSTTKNGNYCSVGPLRDTFTYTHTASFKPKTVTI